MQIVRCASLAARLSINKYPVPWVYNAVGSCYPLLHSNKCSPHEVSNCQVVQIASILHSRQRYTDPAHRENVKNGVSLGQRHRPIYSLVYSYDQEFREGLGTKFHRPLDYQSEWLCYAWGSDYIPTIDRPPESSVPPLGIHWRIPAALCIPENIDSADHLVSVKNTVS